MGTLGDQVQCEDVICWKLILPKTRVAPQPMFYHRLLCFLTLIIDVTVARRVAPDEKDLQIVLLRQQLRLLERNAKTKPRLSRPERLMLVVLATRLKTYSHRFHSALREAVLLVQPDTVLKWHRELVRLKWTFRQHNRGGRPRLDDDVEALILRSRVRTRG